MPERATGMQRFMQEIKAELKREATQGSMEFANALFNGHGFVPYGPGQYTPTPEMEKNQGQEGATPQRENDGMER